MPRAACVKCGVFLKCSKVGRAVLERDDVGEPYALWRADEYSCPVCEQKVIVGFGQEPWAQHWEQDFEKLVAESRAADNLIDGGDKWTRNKR